MSQLDGFFSLRTPRDLLSKLEADFARLRAADPISIDAQYAAFDFFVTAEHLPDWIFGSIGGSLKHHRAYTEYAIVSHVANGAKHFRVDPGRHTVVKDTRAHSGAFQSTGFQATSFDIPRLVLDLEDGSAVPVLEIAERVINHWRQSVS